MRGDQEVVVQGIQKYVRGVGPRGQSLGYADLYEQNQSSLKE